MRENRSAMVKGVLPAGDVQMPAQGLSRRNMNRSSGKRIMWNIGFLQLRWNGAVINIGRAGGTFWIDIGDVLSVLGAAGQPAGGARWAIVKTRAITDAGTGAVRRCISIGDIDGAMKQMCDGISSPSEAEEVKMKWFHLRSEIDRFCGIGNEISHALEKLNSNDYQLTRLWEAVTDNAAGNLELIRRYFHLESRLNAVERLLRRSK